MDKGTWWAIVHGATKSWIWLSNHNTFTSLWLKHCPSEPVWIKQIFYRGLFDPVISYLGTHTYTKERKRSYAWAEYMPGFILKCKTASHPNHCCCCCSVASVVSDSVWPHRRHPRGSPVPGILQARTLEWVAVSFSSAWKWKEKMKLLSRVRLFATPRTCSLPGSSVHGIFPGKSTGVGCHCLLLLPSKQT